MKHTLALVIALCSLNSFADTSFDKLQDLFRSGNKEFAVRSLTVESLDTQGLFAGKCAWHSHPNVRFPEVLYVYRNTVNPIAPLIGSDEEYVIATGGHPKSKLPEDHYEKLTKWEADQYYTSMEEYLANHTTLATVKSVHPYGGELAWRFTTGSNPNTSSNQQQQQNQVQCTGTNCVCSHDGAIRSLNRRVYPYQVKNYFMVELRCPFDWCSAEACEGKNGNECPNPPGYKVPRGTPIAYCLFSTKNMLNR